MLYRAAMRCVCLRPLGIDIKNKGVFLTPPSISWQKICIMIYIFFLQRGLVYEPDCGR